MWINSRGPESSAHGPNPGFRPPYTSDVATGRSVENPQNLLEREPRQGLSNSIYARWQNAEKSRSEMRVALFAAVRRDGADSYWSRLLYKFDSEMQRVVTNKPDITHGLQSDEQFNAWYEEQANYLVGVEKLIAEWQQALQSPIGTVDVRTEAEMQESLRMYDQTQVLHAKFAAAYIFADEMLHTTSRPIEERRAAVLKAVAELNAFGSHLYRYYAGQKVPPEQIEAYVKGTRAFLESKGDVEKDEKLKLLVITADEQGIQDLLKLRTEMLGTLSHKNKIGEDREPVLAVAHMVAMRREREYLKRTRVTNDRTRGIDDTIDEQSSEALYALMLFTDKIDERTDPHGKLVAAQRELLYMREHHPTHARIARVDNRSNDNPGFIQQALAVQYTPLRAATERARVAAVDQAGITSFLDAISVEEQFLKRHAGMMQLGLDPRVAELGASQDQILIQAFKPVMPRVTVEDPTGSVGAIEAFYTEYRGLIQRPDKAALVEPMTKQVVDAVRGPILAGVNRLIRVAETLPKDATDDARVKAIDDALTAIAAETRLLTSLNIDANRVTLLQQKTTLLDERITIRKKKEAELAPGAKKQPEEEDFHKFWTMLQTEKTAIQTIYASDPKTMNAKLAEVTNREAKLRTTITTAANTAVANLNTSTSSVDDANRAEALLKVVIRQMRNMKDGQESFQTLAEGITDPDVSKTMIQSHETIVAVRTAAIAREKATKVAAAKKAAEEAAAKKTAEELAAKKAADQLAVQKAAEEAAQTLKDEKPLKQADAIIAEAEAAVSTGTPEKVEEYLQLLSTTSESMGTWKEYFETQGKGELVKRIDAQEVRMHDVKDRLESAQMKILLKDSNSTKLVDATNIFRGRYMQFQTERQEEERIALEKGVNALPPSRDLTVASQRLWDDLNGTNDSLLPQAIAMEQALGQDLVTELMAMAGNLAANPLVNSGNMAFKKFSRIVPTPAQSTPEVPMPNITFDPDGPKRPL